MALTKSGFKGQIGLQFGGEREEQKERGRGREEEEEEEEEEKPKRYGN